MVDSESQSVLRKEEPFMVTITLHCPHCQSEALVRNGHAPNGKQLYRCRACGRQSRENPTPHAYQPARREEILHAPDPEYPTSTTLEPYRLWSFVLKKANDCWIWIALCRKSRQVVADAVGDRSRQDVSTVVGGHSRGISPRALLHGFLGNRRSGDPGGATHSRGPARPEKRLTWSGGTTPCANDWPVLSV